jgi:hypothetical protein
VRGLSWGLRPLFGMMPLPALPTSGRQCCRWTVATWSTPRTSGPCGWTPLPQPPFPPPLEPLHCLLHTLVPARCLLLVACALLLVFLALNLLSCTELPSHKHKKCSHNYNQQLGRITDRTRHNHSGVLLTVRCGHMRLCREYARQGGSEEPLGESLAWSCCDSPPKQGGDQVVDMWKTERDNYNYGPVGSSCTSKERGEATGRTCIIARSLDHLQHHPSKILTHLIACTPSPTP